LQTALDGKSNTNHNHNLNDLTEKSYNSLTDKPSSFPPSAHSHIIGDVTGLQTALDGKQPNLGFTPENVLNKGAISGYAGLDVDQKLAQNVDASKIVSGTIDIARLPKAAVERLVVVADQAARFALTTDTVQNGDTVKENDTGLMYFVIDDTKLGESAGYTVYVAGAAASVPWAGVTGKPLTFTPSAHSHIIGDVTGLQTALDGKSNTNHNHNLNDLAEKSYNSLADKPDLTSLHSHANKSNLDSINQNLADTDSVKFKEILSGKEFFITRSTSGIAQWKVVTLVGDYILDEIPDVSVLTALSQTPLGISVAVVSPGVTDKVLKRGRAQVTGFNTSGSAIGNKVYCDATGSLTLTQTDLQVGLVESLGSNGVIYFNFGGAGGAGANNITTSNTFFVDLDAGNNTTGDGSLGKPTKNVNKLMQLLGQPSNQADFKRKIHVFIAVGAGSNPGGSGEYVEDVDIPHRAICFHGAGVRIVGNITRWISDAREYGTPSADFRGCATFLGEMDGRDNHNLIRSGFQISGNLRTRVNSATITSISGDGALITVVVTPDSSLGYNAQPGLFIKISGTSAYNGNYTIVSRLSDNSFTINGTGTGAETSGTLVETDDVGATGTTHDASFVGTRVNGNITVDDNVVNSAAPTAGGQVNYFENSQVTGNIEGRTIILQRCNRVAFTGTIIASAFNMLQEVEFFANITLTSLSANVSGWRDVKFNPLTFALSGSNQTANVNLVTYNSILTNITWSANTPNFVILDGSVINVGTLAIVRYISATGNDSTGTGLIGAPYFSLKRALLDIPEYSINCSHIIYCADGTYDFSALGDLIINKKMILGSSSCSIKICSQSNINSAFTIVDSGTFQALTDLDSNIHIDTSKSWTGNEHEGRFLRIKTMNSGSLPNNGDGVSYTYRIIPILKNGTNYLETGFVSLGSSQDIADYDIVDHNVVFNFGSNYINVTDDSYGTLNIMGVRINSTGNYNVGYNHTVRNAHMPFWAGVYNCALNIRRYEAIDGYLITSYLSVTQGYCDINVVDGGVFKTSYNTSGVQKFSSNGDIRDAVFWNVASNKDVNMIFINNQVENDPAFSGHLKFINIQSAFNAGNCTFSGGTLPSKLYFDTVDFLFDCTYFHGKIIRSSSEGYPIFKNEPAIGRITYDGVNSTEEYFDLENSFNALCIAPDNVEGHVKITEDSGYAIKIVNKTGAPSVKGMIVAPNNKTIITIVGDSGAQLSNLILYGVRSWNSNHDGGPEGYGEIYWELSDIAGTRTFKLFKENTHVNLIAQGSRSGDGVIVIAEQNNSEIRGSVTVAYTVDDIDIINSITVPMEMSFINVSNPVEKVSGVVYESGVPDGHPCWVVKRAIAEFLVEDGQAIVRGQYLVPSSVQIGRIKGSNTIQPYIVAFASESMEAGTDKLVHGDTTYSIRDEDQIYADSILTDTPGESVQDKIDNFEVNSDDQISFVLDNHGTAIPAGANEFIRMKFKGTILGWYILSDSGSGSIEIDVKKCTYAGYPTASSIAGTELPTLASQQKNSNLVLSSWTKTFNEGDYIQFYVNSASVLTRVRLFIIIKRYP
jgi:hypothetical protein